MTRRALVSAGVTVALAWLVLLLLRDQVAQAASEFPDPQSSPWFVPGRALQLYVAVPLSAVAAWVVLGAPGVLLRLAAGGAARWDELVLHGFLAAFLLHVVAHAFLVMATGGDVGDTAFLACAAALTAATFGLVAVRVLRNREIAWPLSDAGERRRACWSIATLWACVAALVPVILWKDMNDDGVEALEAGRSLAHFVTPRFPTGSGVMGLGAGLVSTSYPVHWCARIFGDIDAAARLPLALYLPVLFSATLALAELGGPRRLRAAEETAVAAGLAVFVVAMSFSASYDPYVADIAAPAASESLTVLCMLGAAHALFRGRTAALVLFGLLGVFARPTGLAFLLLLGLARWICDRETRRATALRVGLAAGACVLASAFYERVYLPRIAEAGTVGYGSGSVLHRLRYLQFSDVGRLLYWVVPCGILPAVALVAVRYQDAVARSIALLALGYFMLFQLQAFVALHHFAPVMILPLVVHWRVVLRLPPQRWAAPATLVAALTALVLSLPRSAGTYRRPSEVASTVSWEVGDYDGTWPEHRRAIECSQAVFVLFPADWAVADLDAEWAGAPLTIARYAARRPKVPGPPQYVIRPAGSSAPDGCRLAGTSLGADVWVRDGDRWAHDRTTVPTTDYRSPVYAIPRETLFSHVGVPAGAYDLDVRSLLPVRDPAPGQPK